MHEELRAALGTNPYERTEVPTRLLQWHQSADADGTDGARRAHAAARHTVRRREGTDVEDRPALSPADA